MLEDKLTKYFEVFLVEDNNGDARLVEEILCEEYDWVHLSRVDDGVKALSFLRKEGEYVDASRPDLILLDLNMPRKDGREVLAEIKRDPNLKSIPVVVLTTSEADEDISKSYELQVNSYISKPVDLEAFYKVIRSIEDYWLTLVKLPPK